MSSPVVEILTIGTELLLGDTIDTNAAWLGERLAAIGLAVTRRSTVGDDFAHMRDALRDAVGRADVVICTGGLGPTHDDFTREVVADVIARPLELDESWLRTLETRYGARGVVMPRINQQQAMAPRGAVVLPNPRGSAPALWIEHEGTLIILLPGVPVELRTFGEHEIIPRLRTRYPDAAPVRSVRLRVTGIGESALAESVADIIADIAPVDVAFLPSIAGVDIRLTLRAADVAAGQALERARGRMHERIGIAVFGREGDALPAVTGALLQARGWTAAFADSCTAGLAAALMTDIAGSSAYVNGGVVCYADQVKVDVLGVDADVIRSHGAVSEATVRAMASGVRRVCGADCGVAISGIAGPGGGTPEKPVGTVWIAAETPTRTSARRFHMFGDRSDVRERSAHASIDMLRRALLEDEPQ